ncbi:hypothetical protein Pan44_44960 [Caulifigura coniformis]|uniref:Uncharacterized protein n=1 Tax=Caulifigura coniformis TaxID=2527983 RepID=A0A517SJZ4_9PLAN|nr:hypothetical protein [Caulifigura coniformis]QDT56442.1 hypothetical protein Pan44_44960 [Caulifigura coniformis]
MNSAAPLKQSRGGLALLTSGLAIGLVWLVVLPWLSSLPSQSAYIDWLRAKRIDPSARYYTEVEAMEPILQRLNEQTRASRAK